MSVLYVIVGAIALAVAIFVCVGVGKLTKYLLKKRDSEYRDDHDEVPSFLVGFFVIAVLAIVISLVVVMSHLVGESIINALNK